MKVRLTEITRRLRAVHRGGGSLTLLFDYDGTLAPLVSHPRLAGLPSPTRHMLKQLAAWDRVHVGILSGRGLDDLREMVRLDGLLLSGSTGLEFDLGGRKYSHPEANRIAHLVEDLIRRFQRELATFPGAWVEIKPLGFTLHYRAVSNALTADFLGHSTAILASHAESLRVLHGPKALEIVPALGWNKGTAVRQILEHLGTSGSGLLYAGDSENDAEGLKVAAELGGLAVGVGPLAPSIAQYRLSDPAALSRLLTQLHQALVRDRISSAVSRA